MSAKIKDVAEKANVSIATVSRVINNVPLVNEETRQRVLEAIRETGYRPNAIARSLKLQKTETVGVVIDDITIPAYAQIARGVQDICLQNGYNTIVCNSDDDQSKAEAFVDLFYQKQCDGIIFAGRDFRDSVRKKIEYLNIPVIMCGLEAREANYNCVVNDNENSIRELVSMLKSRGYESFSIITCSEELDANAAEQKRCLEKEAERNAMTIDAVEEIPVQYNMKNGYEAASKILNETSSELIICQNDDIIVGANKAISERGLEIGSDIGVASLNVSELGRWLEPSIAGINNYMYDVGAISARMLVKFLAGEPSKEKKVVVAYEIIEGGSLR